MWSTYRTCIVDIRQTAGRFASVTSDMGSKQSRCNPHVCGLITEKWSGRQAESLSVTSLQERGRGLESRQVVTGMPGRL
ncbi:hypothetical protein SEA_IKELOA_224 [Mycobacterium phage IkeLoa]|nr:hypothetical protein SEA_IKELOA_224 [Mycobacterium phage IkeLoa]